MTLAHKAEIRLKKYERINDDDPSVMHIYMQHHRMVKQLCPVKVKTEKQICQQEMQML